MVKDDIFQSSTLIMQGYKRIFQIIIAYYAIS